MEEIWKDISGYEGVYQISSIGRVRSLDRLINNRFRQKIRLKKSQILKERTNSWGYNVCVFKVRGVSKGMVAHRLVAMAFIPNPQNKPCVNHKNGIKTDNSIENLEWCTRSENTQHAFDTGLISAWKIGRSGYENGMSKEVFQYTKDLVFIDCYGSTMEASRKTGACHGSISKCAIGTIKSAGGYIWRYDIVNKLNNP